MKTLSIDIETYSDLSLFTTGVYPYAAHESFRVLLFAYSVDHGPVQVIDLAQGETLPDDVLAGLTDPTVVKWAFNAAFERVCLSTYLGVPLDPVQWRCSMVWCSYLGLPMSLKEAGRVLGVALPKLETGRALIKKFCVPDPQGRRLLPEYAPEAWDEFKAYCRRDVEVELQIHDKLTAYPVPESEWAHYQVDQAINDRGIMIDRGMVDTAISVDEKYRELHLSRARELTGLENPNSPIQLLDWLDAHGYPLENLNKASVKDALAGAQGEVAEVLTLRRNLAKSSVKKYQAMANCACRDGRARGLIQFYGAGRTGRYAGRLVQVQNLPRNQMLALDQARQTLVAGDYDGLDMLFDPIPHTLSELVRTAFIPQPGCEFIVADYAAIEARVIAWLAGETWRLDMFKQGGDIYCQSASAMFGVPVEKHGVNGELRQKGKIAELACGYGGSVGALKAMGALDMGLTETELKPIVNAWRSSNPNIVKLWWAVDTAVKTTIREHATTTVGPLTFTTPPGLLRIQLPSGRHLSYARPRLGVNRFGGESVVYDGVGASKKWEPIESYGPKFVENIVQAVSRDLLAHALQRLETAGLRTVMHVHDEVVIESPKGAHTVSDITRIITALPEWATGLPLAADGYTCDYYKKD